MKTVFDDDADEDGAGGVDGLFYGGGLGSLGDQTLGALVAIAWSGVFTAIIGLAIKYTMGWRISEDAEVEGIDFAEHGEAAYDLVNRGGGSLAGGAAGLGSSTGVLNTKTQEGASA